MVVVSIHSDPLLPLLASSYTFHQIHELWGKAEDVENPFSYRIGIKDKNGRRRILKTE